MNQLPQLSGAIELPNFSSSPKGYFSKTLPTELCYGSENIAEKKSPPWSTDPPIIASPTSHHQKKMFIHTENGGALGMVPLIIKPIYSLYHVGPNPLLKGSNRSGPR